MSVSDLSINRKKGICRLCTTCEHLEHGPAHKCLVITDAAAVAQYEFSEPTVSNTVLEIERSTAAAITGGGK